MAALRTGPMQLAMVVTTIYRGLTPRPGYAIDGCASRGQPPSDHMLAVSRWLPVGGSTRPIVIRVAKTRMRYRIRSKLKRLGAPKICSNKSLNT